MVKRCVGSSQREMMKVLCNSCRRNMKNESVRTIVFWTRITLIAWTRGTWTIGWCTFGDIGKRDICERRECVPALKFHLQKGSLEDKFTHYSFRSLFMAWCKISQIQSGERSVGNPSNQPKWHSLLPSRQESNSEREGREKWIKAWNIHGAQYLVELLKEEGRKRREEERISWQTICSIIHVPWTKHQKFSFSFEKC